MWDGISGWCCDLCLRSKCFCNQTETTDVVSVLCWRIEAQCFKMPALRWMVRRWTSQRRREGSRCSEIYWIICKNSRFGNRSNAIVTGDDKNVWWVRMFDMKYLSNLIRKEEYCWPNHALRLHRPPKDNNCLRRAYANKHNFRKHLNHANTSTAGWPKQDSSTCQHHATTGERDFPHIGKGH